MKRTMFAFGAFCAFAIATRSEAATIVFSDDFETNTSANYTTNTSTGNHAATFAYDYSAVGIPPAPGSGVTTRGLKLEANYLNSNNATETNGGVSVSPIGVSVSGDFNIRAQVWMNTLGPLPAGGSGSTELTTFGWGTAGTTAQWFNSRDSIVFGVTGEAGASQDYVVYPNGALAANNSPIYAATAVVDPEPADSNDVRNHDHIHYGVFGNTAPPAAQLALFSEQTGSTIVGAAAFDWRDMLIKKRGNLVTWSMDGLLIATVDVSTVPALGGSNIFFGQSDINNTASTSTNVRSLLFGLVDNVSVITGVPEPTSLTLFGLCAASLCFIRKHR